MRSIIMLLASALLCSCNSEDHRSRWQYRQDVADGFVGYDFNDGQNTVFGGLCKPETAFLVSGGEWQGDQFRLTVDGKTWNLPAMQLEHGHILKVDSTPAVEAIANASKLIVFEVGKWRRELVPVPLLRTFLETCRRHHSA